MANCPKCGHDVAEDVKFCPECGAEIHPKQKMRECPKCHTQVPEGTKFCTQCGREFLTDETDSAWVRKHELQLEKLENVHRFVSDHEGLVQLIAYPIIALVVIGILVLTFWGFWSLTRWVMTFF